MRNGSEDAKDAKDANNPSLESSQVAVGESLDFVARRAIQRSDLLMNRNCNSLNLNEKWVNVSKGVFMANQPNGMINADDAYSKRMVLERLGISQKFWDKNVEDGLPFTEIGHTRWVTGKNLIEYPSRKSEIKQD